MIRTVIALSVAVTLASVGMGWAQSITVFTGVKGGGYDSTARMLEQRLEQRGLTVEVENRKGSDDITLQACSNDSSVWIAQSDALWKREMNEGCLLEVLADYGDEVGMLFFPPNSSNKKLSHLSSGDLVFVAGVGSGSELTFANQQSIEKEHGRSDEWSDAQKVTGDVRRLSALANRGKVTAAFLVTTPNSKSVQKMIDSGWRCGEMYDKDINDLMWGDKPLYEPVKYTAGKKTCWGYRVPSFIGTTEAIALDQPELFDKLLGALN